MTPQHQTNTAHSDFKTLPVVNVSDLFSPDLQVRMTTAKHLGMAAQHAGFMYISGHGISSALIDGLLKRTQAFFAQPLEQKMKNYIGLSTNHSGYVPEGEEQFAQGSIDHKEAYDIGFDFLQEQGRRPMLGPNQWPALDGFKADIKAYYDAVFNLSRTLFKGFALALGLPEDTFARHVSTPPSQLRLVHYPFDANAPVDRPGIGAHTDYECFTVLLPTAPGLEVLNGAGTWVDVPPLEGTFVINIGDMLQVLSNGIYVATSHRVRKVGEERYSFPMFCACDYDTLIEPVSALCDEGRQAGLDSLICGEHLYAQTLQTFGYLKQRLKTGELKLPEKAKALSSFGHKIIAGEQ